VLTITPHRNAHNYGDHKQTTYKKTLLMTSHIHTAVFVGYHIFSC